MSVALRGEFRDVHLTGDNADVLPTDTTENTVYAFAKEQGVESPEAFGIAPARHFVGSQPVIHETQIRRSSPGTGTRPCKRPTTGSSPRR